MKKIFLLKSLCIFTAIVLFSYTGLFAQESKLNLVVQTIEDSNKYDAKKKAEIDSIRTILKSTKKSDVLSLYNLNTEMFYRFKVFQRDSAFYYGIQSKTLAQQLHDKSFLATANMNLADICVSSGMYKEALDFLEPSKIDDKNTNYNTLYYGILGRCYGDMAEYSNTPYFNKQYLNLAHLYREKALSLTEDDTFFHYFLEAFNKFKEDKLQESFSDFKTLLQKKNQPHDQALVHYMLGELYQQLGNNDKAISHFSEAVISDIKTSTKESLAIIKLSELLFKKGDLNNASILIKKANEDASFYGAQQRKIQVGAILPLVEQEILKLVEKEKQRLYWQYIIVSIFLIIAICFAIIIYNQNRKLTKARKIIADAHQNLKQINKQLLKVNDKIKSQNIEIKHVNSQLSEANKIKEEYLGLFFTQYDGIFEKFNAFINSMKKNIEEERYDKVNRTILSYNLKREKEKLLENFDKAFVSLFPNFIKEFNSLMKEEHKILLDKEQVLTKELRIYALIRLGITQNEIIAQILGYSVNSIYAYKTKIRNNSSINKEDFDKKLLKNTTLKL
ncbi:DUF6377 domain-containing protein [Flavobacterium daejeonense]|uniref:DUF6377 domain-containing protein n=1 Tax=Flavobacterium daejeonense TaxID=350893 RepID=UPI000479EFFF|nr:DUF6377 domain-containing protein [Flavobacterium daejeonense]